MIRSITTIVIMIGCLLFFVSSFVTSFSVLRIVRQQPRRSVLTKTKTKSFSTTIHAQRIITTTTTTISRIKAWRKHQQFKQLKQRNWQFDDVSSSVLFYKNGNEDNDDDDNNNNNNNNVSGSQRIDRDSYNNNHFFGRVENTPKNVPSSTDSMNSLSKRQPNVLPVIGPLLSLYDKMPLLLGQSVILKSPTPMQYNAIQEALAMHRKQNNTPRDGSHIQISTTTTTKDTTTQHPLIAIIDDATSLSKPNPISSLYRRPVGRYATIAAIVCQQQHRQSNTISTIGKNADNTKSSFLDHYSVKLLGVGRAVLTSFQYQISTASVERTTDSQTGYITCNDEDDTCNIDSFEETNHDDDNDVSVDGDIIPSSSLSLRKDPTNQIIVAEFYTLSDHNNNNNNHHHATLSPNHALARISSLANMVQLLHTERQNLVRGIRAAKSRLITNISTTTSTRTSPLEPPSQSAISSSSQSSNTESNSIIFFDDFVDLLFHQQHQKNQQQQQQQQQSEPSSTNEDITCNTNHLNYGTTSTTTNIGSFFFDHPKTSFEKEHTIESSIGNKKEIAVEKNQHPMDSTKKHTYSDLNPDQDINDTITNNYGLGFGPSSMSTITLHSLTQSKMDVLVPYYSPSYRSTEEYYYMIYSMIAIASCLEYIQQQPSSAVTAVLAATSECTDTYQRLEMTKTWMERHIHDLKFIAHKVCQDLIDHDLPCNDLW